MSKQNKTLAISHQSKEFQLKRDGWNKLSNGRWSYPKCNRHSILFEDAYKLNLLIVKWMGGD